MVHKTSNDDKNVIKNVESESVHVIERKSVIYKDLSSTLVQEISDYSKQFAHIYAARLAELGEVLTSKVHAKWKNVQILKLADLEDFEGETCIIIGTLYKHQQWKPSILQELSEEHQLSLPPTRSDYCSEKDQVFLEDEMLRIKLVGELVDLKDIVTGIVCAVLGSEEEDGTFHVKDWCFPGCVPKTLPSSDSNSNGKIVLISGLNFIKNSDDMAIELLREWICGMAGDVKAQKEEASVVRLIIAGNAISNNDKKHTHKHILELKVEESMHAKETISATQKLDDFLSDIAKCCCVTLIPGQYDPTNMMLPQRPLHPCLLPKSSRLGSFQGGSNPWISQIDERMIMGSSGQPFEDFMKATGSKDISPIEWLEKSIIWRHMCPTAPDTLPAYPFYKKDLFIMKHRPDIYFTGNADKYETKLWKDEKNQAIRLVSIPQFSTSHAAVLIDLKSLDTELIHFGIE
ncbi:DNA polymerase delta subunit 2-like isoform X1 [Vespa crabro]|uniref:DNA polymerase delta subunit 2-like isoform X1 n=1 Tax=Vespa crabro TaxID=7445 RepID=UPI001F011975|nr:DNA polymerase delta subunit 2-like isoform X1 [Vespa crabro]XP_046819593.1 DNA polymerase delta subunit 2-like isoform X1 [Vespa crabro]XP_046819594.1 DNA polymerase delta subunit 2-like isoform X1 [Vespa crabro]